MITLYTYLGFWEAVTPQLESGHAGTTAKVLITACMMIESARSFVPPCHEKQIDRLQEPTTPRAQVPHFATYKWDTYPSTPAALPAYCAHRSAPAVDPRRRQQQQQAMTVCFRAQDEDALVS